MFFNDLDCASRAPENNRGCSTTSSEREIDRAYGGKNTARFASEPPESPTWSGETVRNTVMFRYPTGFPNFGTVLHFYVSPRASPPLRDILHRYRRSENRRRISVGLFGNARGDKPIHCRCPYPGDRSATPGGAFLSYFHRHETNPGSRLLLLQQYYRRCEIVRADGTDPCMHLPPVDYPGYFRVPRTTHTRTQVILVHFSMIGHRASSPSLGCRAK